MGTDSQRAKVYTAVAGTWGEDVADAMMAVLPPWDYHEVARKSDVESATVALRSEMAELRGELRGDMAELRARLDAQFGRIVIANTGMMFGFAGILLAAAKFT